MNRKRRAQAENFQEDYWYNTSEFQPDFPGVHIRAFCHSLLMPNWRSTIGKTYNYIMASLILSGKEEIIDENGSKRQRNVGFFSICDLNETKNSFVWQQTETLERYFVLFHVNRLLRKILAELFPSGMPQFIAPQPMKIRRCFEDIRRILRKQGTTDNHLLNAFGFKLLTEAATQEKSLNHFPLPLTVAQRYIDNNFFKQECTRTKIAQAAGVSAVTIGKLFRAHLGTTVNHYLTSLRIEKARQLLEFSETPISSVATQCGFSYSYYFGRIFREATGMTPLEYRRHCHKDTIPDKEANLPLSTGDAVISDGD